MAGYRNQRQALRERRGSLEAERDGLTPEIERLRALKERANALEREIERIDRELSEAEEWKSRLRIASPCTARWEEMIGNDQVRHCTQCRKSVYNLDGMDAADAAALLRTRPRSLCVRLRRRNEGQTAVDGDCRSRARRRHPTDRGVGAGLIAAGAASATVAAAVGGNNASHSWVASMSSIFLATSRNSIGYRRSSPR